MSKPKFNIYDPQGALIQSGEAPLSISLDINVDYTGSTITHVSPDGSKESKAVPVEGLIPETTTTTSTTSTTKAPSKAE